MRLDHIAYRVADRNKAAEFFIAAFGYRVQKRFEIPFKEGDVAQCISLVPPERVDATPWTTIDYVNDPSAMFGLVYHAAPEIFVSDGTPDSVVGRWVAARGGVGGIHHMAYQVEDVKAKMEEWKRNGWADFASEEPMHCDDLTQVFSVPHALTGVIYEFIQRGEFGFCQANVAALMESSRRFS